jgi:hypothetical protein
VCLRRGSGSITVAEAAAFVREVGAANFRVAINTGHATTVGEEPVAAVSAAGERLGAVLFSAAERDQYGQWYDAHLPVAGRKLNLGAYRELARRSDVPLVLDGAYGAIDEACADLVEAGGRWPEGLTGREERVGDHRRSLGRTRRGKRPRSGRFLPSDSQPARTDLPA